MNMNGITKSIAPTLAGFSMKRRIFDMIPNMLVKDSPKLNQFGNFINRPDVNRGIMGVTALLTQPYIDAHNPDVDHETAMTSMCRTIGKIVAGTTVGCLVRAGCYYLIDACTNLNQNAPAWKRLLMPSKRTQQFVSAHNMDWFKNYKNILATIMGLTAMLFTNVLLDVPFTTLISNKLNSWRKSRQQEGQVKNG